MESFKSLGMPNKTVISNFNAIEDNNTLIHEAILIDQITDQFPYSQ